jgi:nicotinamide-nucleotide amidase
VTDLHRALGVDPTALRELVARYAAMGWTVAPAESVTGGLLSALLTEVPGSSAVMRGGLVVYATDLKHTLADVDAQLLAAHGPVDPDVAHALAHGVRLVCDATVGVGLTGVAGPDPLDGVPVGTWFCAISGPSPHRDLAEGRPAGGSPPSRADIRAAAVRAALVLLEDASMSAPATTM